MKNKILILGGTGMLGHVLFLELSENYKNYEVYSSVRNKSKINSLFSNKTFDRIYENINAENLQSIINIISEIKPDIVINCIGIIKQHKESNDILTSLPINSLFPHQLASICKIAGAKMIHISTDCVFNGIKGNYTENDNTNAQDLYGISKSLGEVNYANTITLRTSIIGHELYTKHGLIEWFMSQEGSVNGFINAIFSGFPTITLAKIIAKYIIPNNKLTGIFNVSSPAINKYDLLTKIAKKYNKKIEIIPSDKLKINRSLNSDKFQKSFKYIQENWDQLINEMHKHYINSGIYHK